ncbi:MAG TPA: ComEC/Rec2 family competence protein, partial [Chitinophagaceae bacterium]|nr:ComEC/Rec2 family competence protein [Chitinophagaceae bacterium]
MEQYRSYFWKKTPFLKLLLALIAGILVQWHYPSGPKTGWLILAAGLVVLPVLFFIPLFKRYRFAFLNGIIVSILFFALGVLLAWQKDIRNQKDWLGKLYTASDGLLVTLEEPPVEKTRSVKANASVCFLLRNGKSFPVKGRIIIYFSKDVNGQGGTLTQLSYGSQIIFKKPVQEIKNAGNPGGFDYKQYALFQGITHQVYLKPGEFEVPDHKKQNGLTRFLFASKEKLLGILRENIKGHKELGLAEALLIGYKQDLDQSLVQSYTNTGVVHIIAISGLHLGLIYWLMALLLRPLQKRKSTRWIRAVIIITVLWIFSLLAGAQPSILRSALMFTCIVLGESLSKKTSIYNTMAVSAFILLCINPYWLWDVGFQLSYAAVLSIIIFMQPIYNLFYSKNKLLDLIWKLNAVTLAAQVLTVPLSIYHFHQFPNFFILTNFLAVPLSSIILLGEIFLCVISFIPVVSILVGKILSWLIALMNTYIERVE